MSIASDLALGLVGSKLRRDRKEFVQQAKALCAECIDQKAYPRNVAAGPIERLDKTELDRVGANRKHDRNRFGGVHCSPGRDAAPANEHHADAEINQLGRESWESFVLAIHPPILDANILTFQVTRVVQALAKCSHN
jgi:hypothetical protein